MKTTNIVLLGIFASIIMLILYVMFRQKYNSKAEILVFIDDNNNYKFKLDVTETAIDDLTTIEEIKDIENLSEIQKSYFNFFVVVFVSELQNNKDFFINFMNLIRSMLDSTQNYVEQISKINPEAVKHLKHLDSYYLDIYLSTVKIFLDNLNFDTDYLVDLGLSFDKKYVNQWLLIDQDQLIDIKKIEYTKGQKINLLPQDELLLKKCTNCLLNFFDNKEKVIFENNNMSEKLKEKQRKFIRLCSRFLIVDYLIYLFLESTKN